MTPTTMSIADRACGSGYFVVTHRQGVNRSLRLLHAPWRWLAATATGAAASESVDVDEVDAYALIAG